MRKILLTTALFFALGTGSAFADGTMVAKCSQKDNAECLSTCAETRQCVDDCATKE
jgi:hypothetical protein